MGHLAKNPSFMARDRAPIEKNQCFVVILAMFLACRRGFPGGYLKLSALQEAICPVPFFI